MFAEMFVLDNVWCFSHVWCFSNILVFHPFKPWVVSVPSNHRNTCRKLSLNTHQVYFTFRGIHYIIHLYTSYIIIIFILTIQGLLPRYPANWRKYCDEAVERPYLVLPIDFQHQIFRMFMIKLFIISMIFMIILFIMLWWMGDHDHTSHHLSGRWLQSFHWPLACTASRARL